MDKVIDKLQGDEERDIQDILDDILGFAYENGIMKEDSIVNRDLFDTKIMNELSPKPSKVIDTFWSLYNTKSPKEATDYFYKLSQDINYIRRSRIKKDQKWSIDTTYGKLDITINLSKPEKDPKDIANMKAAKSLNYPKCLLCVDNEGYAGRINHPARQNLRYIPIEIANSNWGFQYSPYVYYNEHCIVFNGKHTPMKIDRNTFVKLLDFVKLFPHYFLGSNADLPIVGGSILSHDHFQGGNYEFPMANAVVEYNFSLNKFSGVEAGIVKWPMSVIRLKCYDADKLIDAANHILLKWRDYSDENVSIIAETNEGPHNTITPIARFRDNKYELDLVLRNNNISDEYPDGIFHPHKELHHIKRENIGLIEVMGLAVLPARLKEELIAVKECILANTSLRDNELTYKHADWVDKICKNYDIIDKDNIDSIINHEVGTVFLNCLIDAGVYKRNEQGREAFLRFIDSVNI